MLFTSILFWLSASFVLANAAAIIDTRSSSTAIAESMDLLALTQTPTSLFPSLNNATTAPNNTLTKRYDFKTAPFKCHGLDYGYAEVEDIVTGIKHLTSNIKGKPSNAALNCGRVSCSNNAAIWWCNNSKQTLTIDSFGDIASAAQYVQSKCSIWDDGRSKEMVAGEASPAPDWSVVVRKNSC